MLLMLMSKQLKTVIPSHLQTCKYTLRNPDLLLLQMEWKRTRIPMLLLCWGGRV